MQLYTNTYTGTAGTCKTVLINVNRNDYCSVKLLVKCVKHEVVSSEAVTQSIKTSLL